jgi:hypothetical protein
MSIYDVNLEGLDPIDVLGTLQYELKKLLDNDPKVYNEYELKLAMHYADKIKKQLKAVA